MAAPYDPNDTRGPAASNELHLNSVFCDARGMFFSGLNTEALFAYRGRKIEIVRALPRGCHNARPFRDGVVYNDSESDVLRFIAPGTERIFQVPRYDDEQLTHTQMDDSRIARQAFGRGLCAISDTIIAAGSSPSTITLHDLETMKTVSSINLTMDVRNSIHGLEVWPYPI